MLLYGVKSPNVLKIMLALDDLGISYDIVNISLDRQDQYTPQFLELNPNGKVPVLIDSNGPENTPVTIFESAAILIYLAEKYRRLMPADARQRLETLQWLMIQMTGVGPTLGQVQHFKFIAPEPIEYAERRYLSEATRLYDVYEQRLADRQFIIGPSYSIADIALYPWVAYYYDRHGFKWEDRPNLRRWAETIDAMPSTATARQRYDNLELMPLEKMNALSRDRLFGWGEYDRTLP